MLKDKGLVAELISSLRCLPGVGPKSAQRMAFHLLQQDRQIAKQLAQSLNNAAEQVGFCERCRTLTEHPLCSVCNNPARDPSQLCIVESPADVMTIDQATGFKGLYFVLHGRLSPLDGIGPQELQLDLLDQRLQSGEINEMILATNTTVEGEATAYYIREMAENRQVRSTRIAHGVPLGGELDYVDSSTLSHAFSGRQDM
ncbi:MAG: recombination mediator RecR [Gammaproteobacteria bacterium]|nr:recombination mediator RecR [Gammaproteobacteria bacterium]